MTDELENLDKKISEFKENSSVKEREKQPPKPINKAAQMGVELVAGVAIGVGAGLLLDDYFETKPIFLIICFMFGAAAGFLNMIRANNKN